MKKIFLDVLKTIIVIGVKLFARFYSYKTKQKIDGFRTIIFSLWLANEFSNIGKKSTVNYSIIIQGGKYISIGNNSSIGKRAVITAWDKQDDILFTPEIKIGNNVSIGEDCHITAINSIVIGNNVLLGKKITITDNSHGKTNWNELQIPPVQRKWYSKGPVLIEDNVWIGDKATILAGVTIGKNAVVGANSVVTKDVPCNTVVGGIPAKKLI
ncbi:MAG: acyltransferase [Paludibacter sp.]|nr:acyltransferase [Paludibacter sp.]